jgi:hypothetical protein
MSISKKLQSVAARRRILFKKDAGRNSSTNYANKPNSDSHTHVINFQRLPSPNALRCRSGSAPLHPERRPKQPPSSHGQPKQIHKKTNSNWGTKSTFKAKNPNPSEKPPHRQPPRQPSSTPDKVTIPVA